MRVKLKATSRKLQVVAKSSRIRRFFCLPVAIAVFVVSCVSCSKEEHPPIPRAQMEVILKDVQTAEVYSTMAGKDSTKDFGQKNEDSLAVYYASIFKHYGISSTDFKTAVEWYRAHPAELDSVYARMLPKMEASR